MKVIMSRIGFILAMSAATLSIAEGQEIGSPRQGQQVVLVQCAPVRVNNCRATEASRPASAVIALRLTTSTLASVIASADSVCSSENSRPKISPGR